MGGNKEMDHDINNALSALLQGQLDRTGFYEAIGRGFTFSYMVATTVDYVGFNIARDIPDYDNIIFCISSWVGLGCLTPIVELSSSEDQAIAHEVLTGWVALAQRCIAGGRQLWLADRVLNVAEKLSKDSVTLQSGTVLEKPVPYTTLGLYNDIPYVSFTGYFLRAMGGLPVDEYTEEVEQVLTCWIYDVGLVPIYIDRSGDDSARHDCALRMLKQAKELVNQFVFTIRTYVYFKEEVEQVGIKLKPQFDELRLFNDRVISTVAFERNGRHITIRRK